MTHIRLILALLAGFLAIGSVANQVDLKPGESDRQRCTGMYDKKTWWGKQDPYISVTFDKGPHSDGDPLASLIIFEWTDHHLIGRWKTGSNHANEYEDKETVCDKANVASGLCNSSEFGSFILEPNAQKSATYPIISKGIHLNAPEEIRYPVNGTGFYCVSTFDFSEVKYTAKVDFRNSYGHLSGPQIPKLPFYGVLSLVYILVAAWWAFLYMKNRHDILPVQNWISGIIGFLIIEQLMTWGFYAYQNKRGMNTASKGLMFTVAILNAGRNSFSFFLLLIVCLGYGVVKMTLGRTMLYVRILTIAHFIFGVIYAVCSLSVNPEEAGPLVLLVVLPLAATMTAFYVWTLNAMGTTMKDLANRKQNVKALMYKKLWWCILVSIIVIFGFFFLNSVAFAGSDIEDFVPDHWRSRWFILDGWLNIVYLIDIAFIAYVWRPTVNNRRFAMSDEIAQDDEGFEIRSLASTNLDEEEGQGDDHHGERSQAREDSPTHLTLVSPKPFVAPANAPHSLEEDETIFAVGEEDGDRWSDQDASPRNSGEREGLIGAAGGRSGSGAGNGDGKDDHSRRGSDDERRRLKDHDD